jgi:hypothetical protein
VKELRIAFYKFLKFDFVKLTKRTEHNTEPLEFLVFVSNLQNVKTKKNLIVKFLFLTSNYIEVNSPREININGKLRREFLSKIEKSDQKNHLNEWKLQETPEELLLAMRTKISTELYMDSFPRFVRSNIGYNAIKKYKSNPDVVIPRVSLQFPYIDSDFISTKIEESDLSFMEYVNKDSIEWELLDSSNNKNRNIYFSNFLLFPKLSFETSSSKFEYLFPYSFEKTLFSILPTFQMKKYNNNVTEILELRKDENQSVLMFDMLFHFPISEPRKYCASVSLDYDAEKQIFTMILKPNLLGNETKWKTNQRMEWKDKHGVQREKKCYLMFNFMLFQFKMINDHMTLFTLVQVENIFGWGENHFQKLMAKETGTILHNNISHHMSLMSDEISIKNEKELLENDPIGKLLLNFEFKDEDKTKCLRSSINTNILSRVASITSITDDSTSGSDKSIDLLETVQTNFDEIENILVI